MRLLFVGAVLVALSPATPGGDREVEYTAPEHVLLDQSAVVMITHASAHFDPLELSRPAVNRVIDLMKRRGTPIVCFHDQYNESNPPGLYLYDDWNPLTIVNSGIGHYDFDMTEVRHVICLGGFFWCCERNTVADTLKLWRRDAPHADLRVTQVVDGIFDMAEGVPDSCVLKVREFQQEVIWSQNQKAAITVAQTLSLIDDDRVAIEFLKKQLPEYPADVNVTIDYFGRRIPIVDAEDSSRDVERVPELVLAFRMSNDL